MKFFRNRTLKTQAAYILALLLFISTLQLIVVRWNTQSIEKLHYQETFARQAQIACQQIFMNTNLFLQGRTELSSQLVADINQHDHMLEVLGHGGRIDGTPVFLNPLSRIPRISYVELQKHWGVFKKGVLATINTEDQPLEKEEKLLPGQWLTVSSWYGRLSDDLDADLTRKRMLLDMFIALFIFIDVVILGLAYYLFIRGVIRPVKVVSENTANHTHTLNMPANELGSIAAPINEVIEQLKDASQFVQQIGQGNLGIRYQELDTHYEPGRNKLADALIEMQQKLKELNDEEQKRQWVNEGLSKFVDILRTADSNIQVLGDRIIASLVQYTKANQGGLYLFNDDNPADRHLELIAMFAFDVKKHDKQRIKPGEGILGQTFLEKQTTYITDIPHEYVRITSGLGGTNPKALLIVPLKIDQEVYGVVELASFNEFSPHEIGFVERLGETISSTLATVKSGQRTQRLLEESRMTAETMRSQEEEMRQNMEELAATQEEMARKEQDYIAKIRELEEQLKADPHAKQLDKTRTELEKLQRESTARIQALEAELAAGTTEKDPWAAVEEVEKTLRVNLEALRITREELDKPRW